jgi:hypothetical protein
MTILVTKFLILFGRNFAANPYVTRPIGSRSSKRYTMRNRARSSFGFVAGSVKGGEFLGQLSAGNLRHRIRIPKSGTECWQYHLRGGGGHKISKTLEAPQDTRRQTLEINKFNTVDPEMVGATVKNLVAGWIYTSLCYVIFQLNFML